MKQSTKRHTIGALLSAALAVGITLVTLWTTSDVADPSPPAAERAQVGLVDSVVDAAGDAAL